MLNQKNKNLVVLNTPSNFDLSVFDKIKTKENYHKLIFLIHQVNYFTHSKGVFKINKKAYHQFLGLSNFQLNKLLGLLINEGKLIEHTYTGNSFTGRLSEYLFLDPFKLEDGIKHQYDAGDSDCPEFIKKLVADNWRVLPTDKSSYKREVKEKSKSKKESNLVHQLQSENQQLKAEIERLRGLLPNVDSTIQAIIATPVIASLDVVFQPVKNNKFSKSKDVTLMNHFPLKEDETPTIIESAIESNLHSYQYESDAYSILGWEIILQIMKDQDLSIDEVYEDIYYAKDFKTENIYDNFSIYKQYDFNDRRYNVQIFA